MLIIARYAEDKEMPHTDALHLANIPFVSCVLPVIPVTPDFIPGVSADCVATLRTKLCYRDLPDNAFAEQVIDYLQRLHEQFPEEPIAFFYFWYDPQKTKALASIDESRLPPNVQLIGFYSHDFLTNKVAPSDAYDCLFTKGAELFPQFKKEIGSTWSGMNMIATLCGRYEYSEYPTGTYAVIKADSATHIPTIPADHPTLTVAVPTESVNAVKAWMLNLRIEDDDSTEVLTSEGWVPKFPERFGVKRPEMTKATVKKTYTGILQALVNGDTPAAASAADAASQESLEAALSDVIIALTQIKVLCAAGDKGDSAAHPATETVTLAEDDKDITQGTSTLGC